MPEEGENKNDKWITVTGNGKTKNLLKPKLEPKLHNAFAILSQPNTPTIDNMSGPALQMDDDKTIIPPDSREHRRQKKLPGNNTLSRCFGDCTIVMTYSSTTAFPLQRMNGPTWPKTTPATKNVRQSTQPTPSVAHQALGLPNGDATPHTVWALHSIGRLKRSTRTSM
jgi:hypothetical protein